MMILTGCQRTTSQNDEPIQKELMITALSVGKADAILIETADGVCLIDTGEAEDGAYILQTLQEKGITELKLLMITHYDKDHVGSAAELVSRIPVETILLPDYEGDRKEYRAFMEEIAEHPDVRMIREITDYSFGDVTMRIYPAENMAELMDTDEEYDNDLSLVSKLTYGEMTFLLTGDIEKKRIHQMLDSEIDLHCDWIKMPHHGQYQKAVKELLEVSDPTFAVLTVSEEDPADEKTLDYLTEQGILFYDTTKQDVVTYSDGTRIWMELGN
ncbi:MAG: MBL fold metallo-hydrolase [Lachnospiraceae bacterium]|nr:MBL fold metallo-hydrolase [Lachnospiraceae bacterium]